MKFRVYNGQGHPNCMVKDCDEKIVVELSDRYCYHHALMSVIKHDFEWTMKEILGEIDRQL